MVLFPDFISFTGTWTYFVLFFAVAGAVRKILVQRNETAAPVRHTMHTGNDIVDIVIQIIRQVESMLHIDLCPAIDRILHQYIDIVLHVIERIDAAAEQMIGHAQHMPLLALYLDEVLNRKSRVGHIRVCVQVI